HTRLAFEIGLKLAQERGMGPEQRVPRLQSARARHLLRQDPIEMSSSVRFRRYLHMQSPWPKILVFASILPRKEIAHDQGSRDRPGWIADRAVGYQGGQRPSGKDHGRPGGEWNHSPPGVGRRRSK